MDSLRSAQKYLPDGSEEPPASRRIVVLSVYGTRLPYIFLKRIAISYIKDIFGHFITRTTERSLHLKRDQLINIISPFDDIWKKGGLEW